MKKHFKEFSTLILSVFMLMGLVSCQTQDEKISLFRGNVQHTGTYISEKDPGLKNLKWQFATNGQIFGSPAIWGDQLFVGSQDQIMYALNKHTGELLWHYQTSGSIHSSPLVTQEMVYFSSMDGNFYALNRKDGSLGWKFTTGGEKRFSAPGIHGIKPGTQIIEDEWDFYLSSPVIKDDLVYFGSGDGYLYALDASSGREIWKFKTGEIIHSSPALAYDRVYLGGWDSYLYCLDAQTGDQYWRLQTGVDTVLHNQVGFQGSPALYDSTVYIGCRDAHMYAVDAFTGDVKWKVFNDHSWVITSPAVTRQNVYYGTSDTHLMYVLDRRTGEKIHQKDLSTFIFSSPAVVNDHLYIGTFAGKLYKLQLDDLSPVDSFSTMSSTKNTHGVLKQDGTINYAVFQDPSVEGQASAVASLLSVGSMLSSPVVSENMVYVSSADGNIYALE
ncbi:MAG: outer membrane protein assembly factor BamB family protein [Candidatus Cyclobacteriaceae bacterium M3_2C_046]